MAYENIKLETTEGIATITVTRPAVMNALNHATLTELSAAVDEVRSDESARVLIITGEGEKAFIAGADIGELKEVAGDAAGAKSLAAFGQEVFRKIEDLGKPSIAMVNGFALGGGCELALACTLRTAAAGARMGLPEVSLGIIPGYGGTQRLSRVAGPGVAREWVLTGDMFTAEQAQAAGVVNRVFPADELQEGTHKMAKTMLSRGPVALRLALEAIRKGLDMDQRDGEEMETDMFGTASETADMLEGMSAFLEKRKAEFKGN
ncbi:MAG: enoyl-CoA hydratase-related protein [Planctomycetes bacterium]|nr:enoyl-CoA hydratase-related protein [Planctomycetota bacterium]